MTVRTEASPWIEKLARLGYMAKALLYGTIGAMAAAAAIGNGGATTDTRGAMARLRDVPFGGVMLGLMAAGLLGYGVWRIVAGFADPEGRGSDAKGLAIRASFVVRGLAHIALAFSAMLLGRGSSAAGGEGAPREATSTALALPGGAALLWAIALGLGAYGVYQLYRAAAAKLSKQLDLAKVAQETGRWIIGVSRFGIAARGLVFLAIGWQVSRAAAEHDASEAGGIDRALDELARFGRWPFAAIAVGLIAYGVYELLNARYRRIKAE